MSLLSLSKLSVMSIDLEQTIWSGWMSVLKAVEAGVNPTNSEIL